MEKETEALRAQINELEEEIRILASFPRTRESAVGGGVMIQPAHIIKAHEAKDEQLGKLKAKLHLLENPDGKEELELIYYGKNHIIGTKIRNGILVSGGLLEGYFKGRVATEHHGYVIGRHGKSSEKAEVLEVNVERSNGAKQYAPFIGTVVMKCKIGNSEYVGSLGFRSRVDTETYFYFAATHYHFYRTIIVTRGLSEKEKGLITYLCAMEYRKKYNPNANINLVDH